MSRPQTAQTKVVPPSLHYGGSTGINWTVRENVRAQMRVMIKRILRRYEYPPDKQTRATERVLEQAEVICRDWAEAL